MESNKNERGKNGKDNVNYKRAAWQCNLFKGILFAADLFLYHFFFDAAVGWPAQGCSDLWFFVFGFQHLHGYDLQIAPQGFQMVH